MIATLQSQQRELARGLTGNDPTPALAQLRPLCGQPPRLEAYRHAYRARLIAALRSNYPVLHLSLGDDDFEALALDYLATHPSRHPSIRWYGHALVDHLNAQADAQALHPALIDLARMEWALCLSFDAPDAPALTAADLASTPTAEWHGLRFRPHPTVQVLQLGWSVEPAWRALTDDALAQAPEPQASPHALLVWRLGLETRWRSLDPPEAEVLQAACQDRTFGELCAQAANQAGGQHAAATVAAWLHRWLADGLFQREA
jgi:hypothetical protein